MRITQLRLPALGLLAPALTLFAHAQGPPTSVIVPVTGLPLAAPANFDAEPFVILSNLTVIDAKADGTGYREQTIAVKVQSDATLRELGIVALPFASASEHVEFHYVRVRRPDGTVLETNVADAIEEAAPVTREAPFYSDLKQKELPVKNLHVGDTLEWQARIVRSSAEAPGEFWGQYTFPTQGVILSQGIELRVPASATVNVWTNPKDGPAPDSILEAGERVYRWKRSNLKPTVGPQAEAAKKAQETRVLTADEETDNTEGKLPSLAWTTFPDWASVGAWYRKLESQRTAPDAAIKAKVAEITADKTSDEDKARAIYAYVSTQIRYIGVAFGIGRYQPHNAAEVLTNQYGDCKDKHTLLAAMLAAVGISSDAVLIGEDIRFNQAVPSPEAFNHLITRAHLNGQTIWLDATTEVAPWRVLLYNLRDKSSLVVPDDGAASIATTPADLPYPATEIWAAVGTLDADGTSNSHISITLHDDAEVIIRAVLHQASPSQYAEFTKNIVSGMGYLGTGASNGDFTRPDDLSKPFSFSFDYRREKAGDWNGLRTIAQLQPVELPLLDPNKPPTSAIQLGVPRTLSATAEMKLPAGWTVELPEAIHAKSAFATYDLTFRFAEGKLYSERRVVVLKSKVPVANWKEYKKFQDAADLGSDPYIQLIRNSEAAPGALAPTPSVSNSEAAKLIEEANNAIREHAVDHAKDLLDQAKDINPQQRNLWGTYGYRAYELGIATEAIDDYRKELQYHPDQTWVYRPLIEELTRTNRRSEAVDTLRKAVVADPDNALMQALLVGYLYDQGDSVAAVAAGNAALKRLPASEAANAPLALATATVMIATKDLSHAAELLVPVLKNVDTPSQKNTTAYLLAETGLHLDDAEAAERSALDTLTAETASWTLDEAPATLKQTSSLLAACWDTLGYIFFREGHLPEARNYIEASWRSRQSAEVGLHLGNLFLALKDPSAALDTFQIAYAALPSSTNFSKGKTITTIATQAKPLQEEINAGIAQAKTAGAKPRFTEAHVQLQQMRTYPVGAKSGQHSTVEYRLLIVENKVAGSRSDSGKELEGAKAAFGSMTFPGIIPAGSTARIVLTGYLTCPSFTCEFIVEP